MKRALTAFALIATTAVGTAALAEGGEYHDDSIDPMVLETMSFQGIESGQPRDEIIAAVSEAAIDKETFFELQESGEPFVYPSILEGDIPVALMTYQPNERVDAITEGFDRLDAYWNREDTSWGQAREQFEQAREVFQTMPCTQTEISWYQINLNTFDEAELSEIMADICPNPV